MFELSDLAGTLALTILGHGTWRPRRGDGLDHVWVVKGPPAENFLAIILRRGLLQLLAQRHDEGLVRLPLPGRAMPHCSGEDLCAKLLEELDSFAGILDFASGLHD